MLIIFCSGLTLLALQTAPVQQWLSDELEERFNDRFAGELRIESLRGTLPLDIKLTNVSLSLPADSAAVASQTILNVEEVYLRADLSESLFERFTIARVSLKRPQFFLELERDGRYNIQHALSSRQPRRSSEASRSRELNPQSLPDLSIMAIEIEEAAAHFMNFPAGASDPEGRIQLPESLSISDFSLSADVQLADQQQFINIHQMRALVPDLDVQQLDFSGQFYADERFIELNRFDLQTGASRLRGSLSLEGYSGTGDSFREQLAENAGRLRIYQSSLLPDELRDIMPGLPLLTQPVLLDTELRYRDGEAILERLEASFGESSLLVNGEISRLMEAEDYRLEIERAQLFQDDVRRLGPEVARYSFSDMGLFELEARIRGGRDSLETEFNLRPPEGRIAGSASFSFPEPSAYSLHVDVEGFGLGSFAAAGFDADDFLNSRLEVTGEGVTAAEADARLDLAIYESSVRARNIEQAKLQAVLQDGFLEPGFEFISGDGSLEAEAWIDLLATDPRINLNGRARELDLQPVFTGGNLPFSRLNADFSLDASGSTLDRYAGEAYLNIFDSDYREEHIEEHEFMLSLNGADEHQRKLSIGGTLMEADITSSMPPSHILEMARRWSAEMIRTAGDISYYEPDELPDISEMMRSETPASDTLGAEEQRMQMRARIDDLSLLNKLFRGVPAIDTITNFDASLRITDDELRVETDLVADYLHTDAVAADSLIFRTRASYTPARLTNFFSGSTELQFGHLDVGGTKIKDADVFIDAYDEAFVLQRLRAFTGENIELGAMASAVFSREELDIRIMDFFVGDEDYAWQNIDQTPITIDKNGRVHVERLEFGNLQERFIIDGTFSEDPADSVSYLFSNLQLERISQLIDGEVAFSGILDGTFFTRSLRTDPNFLGDISIEELRLNDNLAGNLNFTSRFNPEERFFDTKLTLRTDSEAHQEYLAREDTGGQHITVEGVVRTLGGLEEAGEEQPLADMDVQVNKVDLWFLPLILDDIFTESGGQGSGSGVVRVSREGRISYDSEFDVENGRLKPIFLAAPLSVSGNLTIDSENGVIFNDMPVHDGRNGTGVLSGQVDFGIYQDETLFDLQLSMDNLRFMDNTTGPDMPFFGTGIGSGTVQLTGNSDEPYISTPSPIRMASNSTISIPLSAEESVESGRFIQFVDTFDKDYEDIYLSILGNGGNGEEEEEIDLTFMEKFEFDLRFESNEAMSVRLIFDEVTSEVLSAEGTGRLRLSLQDEVFQVFGQFDVEGGNYLFVGGDLFARRFSIREGGSISWEGDPVNASIDVQAAYRARPDINQLRGTAGPDTAPVRVPIDLILSISGTLESIENDFFFEFPSGADVTQTATLAATLNSEDTKLLQATSVLLTGNFVPVDTGLNNLFTSQIGAQGLGTLLSSQISSLLNANLSNLDINLNMTGFDEADLGIALYLFDDRLTLRREGVVTGPNSNIGDFDVTYRINQYFSLEAFHRRESLLPSAVSVGQTQTDESYGMGVEARVQFDTWRQLGRRVTSPFRALFSSESSKEEEASEEGIASEPGSEE